MEKVKRTERGWGGHFIAAKSCLFRRNTLLEYGDIKIVVSTVGACQIDSGFMEIGANRYYETMAFYSDEKDTEFHDADVSKPFEFESEWAISELGRDNEANSMHEKVVFEITKKLLKFVNK